MKINLFILDNPAYKLVPFLTSLKKIDGGYGQSDRDTASYPIGGS